MFGIRLNDWNDGIPGQCFNPQKITPPNARHPLVDQVYLGVTSFYVFCLALYATLYRGVDDSNSQNDVLWVGSVQFILHVYMVIALRVSNQSLLDDAALEEEWGFGQVLALIMFGSTLVECAKRLEGMMACHSCQKSLRNPADAYRILLLEKRRPLSKDYHS